MDRPEHLGPMARTLVETFAGLTLPQQQRVFAMLREIMETNERGAAAMGESYGVSETRPGVEMYKQQERPREEQVDAE